MPSAKPQVAVRKSRKRSRRSRTDCTDIVETYESLYNRVVSHTRAETINASFSDKELRIIMGQNKLLINNFDPATGKYTEKTKLQKAETLLTIIGELVEPSDLRDTVPKPQRSSTRPVRRPKTASSPKTSSDSDSSESDGRMAQQALVQQRSSSSGGIRGTSRGEIGGGGLTGSRKSAKKKPKQRRSDPSPPPAPAIWSQPLESSWSSSHDAYSSGGWSLPEPDFSGEADHAKKPPAAACRAVAQATMAAAAHAEAAYRAKLKGHEDSTPDNDVSPSSMLSQFGLNLQPEHRQPVPPMHGYGGPSSSLSGGSAQRSNMPPVSLSEWSSFSCTSTSNGSQVQQMHGRPPPHHVQYLPELEPMQSHHLARPQQQVTHSPVDTRSRLQPPCLELISSAQPDAPWNVADSLTSPIPSLIYSEECQLANEVHEEPGLARVPLEDTTNSPKSQSLLAELESEDVALGW